MLQLAYVSVPKDLTVVKSKIAFNLTRRQLICFGLGAVVAVPSYLFVKNHIMTDVSVLLMIALAMPFFFLALYEKNGLPFARVAANVLRVKFTAPYARPYQTENVKDLLASPEISNIFENSDFILMLNQASGDREILTKALNISPHQLSYVTNSNEGEGLLFFGDMVVPFVDKFPTDLELYRIMTTKPSEVIAG